MIDPNTGQTKLDLGALGQALLSQGYQKDSGKAGILGQMLNAYLGMQMMGGKPQQPYTGTGAAPNLVNNLPDVSGQILGFPQG